MSRVRDEGVAAIELSIGFALIMVPMAMLVLSFAPLLEARTFVRLASAELARSIVISDGDEVAAVGALESMIWNNRFDPADVMIALCGGNASPVTEPLASTCLNDRDVLERGQYVTVALSLRVDVVQMFDGGLTLEASHEHAELVDLYRSIPQP